jgi:endonuclease YncB( thermonuclease family)
MLRLSEVEMGFGPHMQPGLLRPNRRLWRSLGLAILLILATVASRWLPGGRVEIAEGAPRLVDGDSFFLDGREVRLQGIDAPEGRQSCRRDGRDWRCGEDAKRELQRMIAGAPIRCDVHSTDQHGRLLATCRSSKGENLNARMVEQGFAVAFGSYKREESEARGSKRGIWASEFERPQDWRRRNHGGS